MDAELFSDEIRRREQARRKKGPVWTIASFALHAALFVVIILLTPVKSLIFEPKEPAKNAAEDLSSDRIEEIGEELSDVRMNELLEQILAMQAVLHNMDMMKDELAKGYDEFAAKMADPNGPKPIRQELEEFINEVERNQKQAVVAQKAVRDDIASIVDTERKDYLQDAVKNELQQKRDRLQYETVEKTNTAQGNAVNALDKLQVRAEFGGFKKTAEAAAKFFEAQAEASRMQDKVQTDVADIAEGLFSVYANEKWGIPNPQRDLESARKWLADAKNKEPEIKQHIAQHQKDVANCDKELAELRKELEELEK